MTSINASTPAADLPPDITVPPAAEADKPRLWPALVIVGLYWVLILVWRQVELSTLVRFISALALAFFATIAFVIWWVRARAYGTRERLGALAALFAGGAVAVPLTMQAWGPVALLPTALPWVFTTWTAWLLLTGRRLRGAERLAGLVVTILATWGFFVLTRLDGVSGEQRADVRWRWTPTAEERYLSDPARMRTPGWDATGTPSREPEPPLVAGPGDSPTFRGPREDGTYPGVTFRTDWDAHPPKQLWKQRVGPAWSSITVVGGRLFTQEQRGAAEAVVCLDAETGLQRWAHEDPARFQESVSGAGPRATPTFAGGRLFTLGATGILNCFDAVGGNRLWTRSVATETGAKQPTWGFASSPMVIYGLVIVYSGGPGERGIVAYSVETGEVSWGAPAGTSSYASVQRATIAGEEQALILSDAGLTSVDPINGRVHWRHDASAPGTPRAVQPVVLENGQVLFASEGDVGLAMLNVTRSADGKWAVLRAWAARGIEPSFNTFVVHDGAIYGFDGSYLCCADLAGGKRRWKSVFYGRGQVVLLPAMAMLLVLSEEGEAVLVRATPNAHEEVGRFQAIEGKTWNHPVIVHGRLYVRNAEVMACYVLNATGVPPQ